MKKTIPLVSILSACFIILMQSAQAMEYRLAKDLKDEEIKEMLDKCNSSLKKEQKIVFSKSELKCFIDTISTMKTIQEDLPPRSVGIQLLLQILLGLIMVGVVLIFVIGTAAAILAGSLFSLMIVFVLSLIIFLINFIASWIP